MKYLIGGFLAAIGAMGACVFVGGGLVAVGGGNQLTNGSEEAIITLNEFNRLEHGMSYADVVAIVGAEGELTSSSKIEGAEGVMEPLKTVMYQWLNPGALQGNANAIFQNDKLFQKAQFGLK